MDDFEPKEREKIQMGEMVSSSPSDSRDNSSVIGKNFCTRESHPLAIKMEQVPAAFAADLFCNAHDDLCTVEVEDRPRPSLPLSCFAEDPFRRCILSSSLRPSCLATSANIRKYDRGRRFVSGGRLENSLSGSASEGGEYR